MEFSMAATSGYTRTAIGLHWLIALLIIGGFAVGLYMTSLEGLSLTKLKLYSWHKWIGVTVFLLALLRVIWRFVHGAPSVVPGMPAWQARAAHAAHLLLYVLIVAVPLTGFLMSQAAGIPVVYFGLWELPTVVASDEALKAGMQQAHVILNYLMAALVAVHALAAFKHHFIHRDGTLARMLPFIKS
ncbi:cytochrome b [Imbroritus primus]|uniref:Cytochrome b n=1 Tax=Imbroritus primus TaxID=3058603 RepID=A0ACD3STJ2_9BURK|nr:cytochrome b [Burkholderiaceae bacterium PBA]